MLGIDKRCYATSNVGTDNQEHPGEVVIQHFTETLAFRKLSQIISQTFFSSFGLHKPGTILQPGGGVWRLWELPGKQLWQSRF